MSNSSTVFTVTVNPKPNAPAITADNNWPVLPDRQTLEIARSRRAKLKKTVAVL